MCHCYDSPAWKHFNVMHPSFATESRNVILGLCTNGFQPFGQSESQYSSYNLPSEMCMKEQYMFLIVILPYPRNSKDKLDVYLQPLIFELQALREIGVETYDISRKEILCYGHLSYGQLVTFQLTQSCSVGVHLAD